MSGVLIEILKQAPELRRIVLNFAGLEQVDPQMVMLLFHLAMLLGDLKRKGREVRFCLAAIEREFRALYEESTSSDLRLAIADDLAAAIATVAQ